MKTESVLLQTLCVPCGCHCRYCLLSWDGQCPGADWGRSAALARHMADWLRTERPALRFHFSFGYSMEHPRLPEALDLLRELDSVQAAFLQCDGLRIRDEDKTTEFVEMLREHGIKTLNFTYYGTEDYHDRFAGRKGDFAWMQRLRAAARATGLETSVGIPLTRESAPLAAALLECLEGENVRFFVPHAEGRGVFLENIRLRQEDFDALPETVREHMNRRFYRTEAEWMRETPPEPTKRMLLLSLTPENIAAFETRPFAESIAEAEALDDAYYAPLPTIKELLARYGNAQGSAFYSARDLAAKLQKRWLREHYLQPYDVTDERQTGSRRY